MTRRSFVVVGGTGYLACAQTSSSALARLRTLMSEQDLAFIGRDLIRGVSISGASVGSLGLGGPASAVSISPDAAAVGWLPRDAQPFGKTQQGEPVASIREGTSATRKIAFVEGAFGIDLAISAHAANLALLTFNWRTSRRLITVDTNSRAEKDITPLVTLFSIEEAERLAISSGGDRLAIGSRNTFTVLDLNTGRVLANAMGRFPSLSPSGEEVAYVSPKSQLIILSLATGSSKTILPKMRVYGVGRWTPDGEFLLAGVALSLTHLFGTLAAIDPEREELVELSPLGEGGYGADYAWIKRTLLT